MNRLWIGLVIVASSWAVQATAQQRVGPDWRVALDAGVTLGELPYAGVTFAVERVAVSGLSLGLRATGAGKMFDLSHGITSGDPDPPFMPSVYNYPSYPSEWAALETTLSGTAQSGGMVLRAQVGAGVSGWRYRNRPFDVGPMMTGGVGLDVYPIRTIGVGIQGDAGIRGGRPYAFRRISLGLRARL